MRKVITTTVDELLYETAKKMGIRVSDLIDVALRIVLNVEKESDTEEYELVLKKYYLEQQIGEIETLIKKYKEQIEEIQRDYDAVMKQKKKLDEQLNDIIKQLRLKRLQMYINRLRTYAAIYAYKKELMYEDDDVRELIREIKEIKPDFELEKYIGFWELLDGGEKYERG